MIVAEVLARRLAELGVRRVWGEALPSVTDPPGDHGAAGGPPVPVHVPVREADLAVLMADADGRIGDVDGGGRLGAALLPGPILHLSSRPGGLAPLQTVGSPEELLDALVDPPGRLVPGTSALHLDLDLGAPAPEGLAASVGPERETVLTLDPSMAGLRILTVVGVGVVRARGLEGLRSFSRTAGSGVLNTFGAKGVERWDSPWHFGTVGLQARDLELAGLGDADVVVVAGLDPAELPAGALGRVVAQEVHPAQLGALCARWGSPAGPPEHRPRLYDELAAVIGPLYEDDAAPLSPARAALHLSGALPDGGMAVADAGTAGLWVARAFPTSIPNSVCVPAAPCGGFAAAAALCCALEGRAVLAVTDEAGIDAPESGAVLSLAEHLGAAVGLQVWRDTEGSWSSAAQHVALLESHLSAGGVRVDDVPVRLHETRLLEDVAGPVTAWPPG